MGEGEEMDLLSKTEFLILTICFDFLTKQLHTTYAPGQRNQAYCLCVFEAGIYNLLFILLYNVLGPPNSIMPYFCQARGLR